MKIPRLTKRNARVATVIFGIGRLVGLSATVVTGVFLLYVLSIGPVCLLNKRGALPNGAKKAYQPLGSLMARSEFFDRAVSRYQCWWLEVPYTQLKRTNTP